MTRNCPDGMTSFPKITLIKKLAAYVASNNRLIERVNTMKTPSRQEVMDSPVVHNFTKEVLKETLNHDLVDCINDLELAIKVLENDLYN